MTSIAEFVRARASDGDRVALRFENQAWTWAEYVHACAQRAAYLDETLDPGRPPHVGVLLDNTPDYVIAIGQPLLPVAPLIGAGVKQ